MLRLPSSGLVVVAWLGTIDGITPEMVDQVLPTDTSIWQVTGFVQVGPEFGSSVPHMYVPVRRPVMEIETWGVNEDSLLPNWELASNLAELIVDACYRNHNLNVPLNVRTGYRQARVTAAWPVTEPHRDRDDPTNYGKYTTDIEFGWIEISE